MGCGLKAEWRGKPQGFAKEDLEHREAESRVLQDSGMQPLEVGIMLSGELAGGVVPRAKKCLVIEKSS